MNKALLLLCVVLQFCHEPVQCRADSTANVSKILENIPFAQVISDDDNGFQESTGIPMSSTQSYHNYSLKDIVSIFKYSMVPTSFTEKGTFHRLLKKLTFKLHQLHKDVVPRSKNERNRVIFLNILFIGGSVCYGHHTYLPNASSTPSVSAINKASSHLSWPRRLTFLLTHALALHSSSISPSKGVQIKVSPRYCCRQATSTTHAVDVMKSQQYVHGRCSRDPLQPSRDSLLLRQQWEPDLVLWDYAVNDMNPHWFLSRPREYVYENFVRTTLTMHAAQIIDFEFINHFAPSPQMKKVSFEQRQRINRYYDIPMIDYMAAISAGCNESLQSTPLYAERLANRHPAWPTHVVWAQLAAGVILTGLVQWKNFASPLKEAESPMAEWPSSKHDVTPLPPPLHNSPEHSRLTGICNANRYSSYYDFGDMRECANKEKFCSLPSSVPLKVSACQIAPRAQIVFALLRHHYSHNSTHSRQVEGNWRLGSDRPLSPMKTGWLYCRSFHESCAASPDFTPDLPKSQGTNGALLGGSDALVRKVFSNATRCQRRKDSGIVHAQQCSCELEDPNLIAFRCANISVGDIKMEYMTSYGDEWASAILQANIKYKKGDEVGPLSGRYILPSALPLEVHSQWKKEQATVSISQEIEASIHDMHRGVAVDNVEYVDVVIRVCSQSGNKFKLLSIACC